MKRVMAAALMTVLLFVLGACAKEPEKPIVLESVTLSTSVPDPPRMMRYVFSADGTVKYYDLTDFWLDHNGFDWLAEELPPEAPKLVREGRLTEGGWERIAAAVQGSRFMSLPEELEPIDACDIDTRYIAVRADGGVHQSGGYGAGWKDDRENRRYAEVQKVLWECIETAVLK